MYWIYFQPIPAHPPGLLLVTLQAQIHDYLYLFSHPLMQPHFVVDKSPFLWSRLHPFSIFHYLPIYLTVMDDQIQLRVYPIFDFAALKTTMEIRRNLRK